MGRRARGITFNLDEWQQVVDLAEILGLAKTEAIRFAVARTLEQQVQTEPKKEPDSASE